MLNRGRQPVTLVDGAGAAPAGSASSAKPPGASGDTARPNYVGPSGNGLVERMNAGESPRNQGLSVKGVPVRSQKAVSRSKEKRRSGAPRGERPSHWACAARRIDVTRAFRRSAPLTFVREHSPHERGEQEMPALPAPRENRGGEALGFCTPAV